MNSAVVVFTLGDIFGIVVLAIVLLILMGYGLWRLVTTWIDGFRDKRKIK